MKNKNKIGSGRSQIEYKICTLTGKVLTDFPLEISKSIKTYPGHCLSQQIPPPLHLENGESAKSARVGEVKQGPKLSQIVLYRRARENESKR